MKQKDFSISRFYKLQVAGLPVEIIDHDVVIDGLRGQWCEGWLDDIEPDGDLYAVSMLDGDYWFSKKATVIVDLDKVENSYVKKKLVV